MNLLLQQFNSLMMMRRKKENQSIQMKSHFKYARSERKQLLKLNIKKKVKIWIFVTNATKKMKLAVCNYQEEIQIKNKRAKRRRTREKGTIGNKIHKHILLV